MRQLAGQVLVDSLAALGARHFYTVPGESFLEVLDATRRNGDTRLISTRHESGASFMAEAEAKLTGVPAVTMATRAVGSANLAIGVHTALHDSTPMIVLVGQVESSFMGRESFQEIDLEAFYRPITKWTASLRDASRAAEVAYQAFVAATTGRPGPVLVVLPSDVLGQATEASARPLAATRLPSSLAAPPPEAVIAIRHRLTNATRPVMIVGGGTSGARPELVQVAERYGTGVYTAFRRQDRFPNDHPLYLGHLTLGTSPRLLGSLREADVVVAIGCRLSEATTQGFTLPPTTAQLIHVDVDPTAMARGKVPDLAVTADARTTLAALLAGAPDAPAGRDWTEGHRAYEEESTPPGPFDGELLHPAEVVGAMAKILPADTIIANDAGNFSIFLHRYWRYCRPATQLAPTSGAMGYGVPAAVAAGLVHPERTAVGVAGDGGFLMTGQEIETAVRYGCDITVVVVRNGLYGTIAMHQARAFGATCGVEIGEVDLAAYARSLGASGFSVRSRSSLGDALAEAVATPGPAVVDVVVDPDVITPTSRLSSTAPSPT
ncbi:MAG: thiamine pyrophosphate-binding protein [Actinomycetota bacterium]|nr:thiamine pyrophosphate-binding protein [Actinomycetota bacterium]